MCSMVGLEHPSAERRRLQQGGSRYEHAALQLGMEAASQRCGFDGATRVPSARIARSASRSPRGAVKPRGRGRVP